MPGTPGAILITPGGDLIEIDLPNTTGERLAIMRSVIRCERVDVVALTTRIDMWFDDEYLYNYEDDINYAATILARRYIPNAAPYHGPVLVTGGADENGDTVPLDRDKLLALLTAIADTAS